MDREHKLEKKNLNNISEFKMNELESVIFVVTRKNIDDEHLFTNVNFCIFKDFPLSQMVIPVFIDFEIDSTNCSCTFLWLIG